MLEIKSAKTQYHSLYRFPFVVVEYSTKDVHDKDVEVVCTALCYKEPQPSRRSDMAHVSKGITQFYLPPTHEPYLPLLPSHRARASPPFGWYSLHLQQQPQESNRLKVLCQYTQVQPDVTQVSQLMQLNGLPATVTPPPAVTMTFDLLTPQSNQHICEPKYISDQDWVKFPSFDL